MAFLLDFLPLLLFFAVFKWKGMMLAIPVLVGASVVCAGGHYVLFRKIPVMMLLGVVLVVIFGGLSLWLHDDTFLKMKPTIINALFALIVWGGWLSGRAPLRMVLGKELVLKEQGWRYLHHSYAVFFGVMACVNELVWRSFSTDVWVNFKVFGMVGVSLVFTVAQLLYVQRTYSIKEG